VLRQGRNPAIVNISSIAGKRGIPARSEYSASKFAVQGFSESLRGELAKDGIDVILVSPGLTQTNFSQNMIERKALMAVDHMRGMTAEDVADATLRAIARGRRETVLTFQGKLMVFINRFLPRLADRIAAKRVRGLFKDEIDARMREQARASGKPESIVERMVDGRLRKFYEEVVLLEQIFVVDQETRISKVVENAAKKAGCGITIAGFARYALGEGIERPRTDFAAEVAAQLQH